MKNYCPTLTGGKGKGQQQRVKSAQNTSLSRSSPSSRGSLGQAATVSEGISKAITELEVDMEDKLGGARTKVGTIVAG